ncbi:MAG: 2-oxo-4-hydroxy-4-carboxy-5-ureidoimidazoline decarboxylase [Pseudomonadota bacterium]
MKGLTEFNALSLDAARDALLGCCASPVWARAVAAARPFANWDALLERARADWEAVDDDERLTAFAAHPLIGDVELLRERFNRSGDRANAEQGQVLDADDSVLVDLARLNVEYRERHGFIFIIFAHGKSAREMRDTLRERLPRSTQSEIIAAAREQMQITELRLRALLAAASQGQ